MFEIFGQGFILKPVLVFDNKRVTLIRPVDDIGVDGVLQNAVGFNDKVGDF